MQDFRSNIDIDILSQYAFYVGLGTAAFIAIIGALILIRRLVRRLILGTARLLNRSVNPVVFRGIRILSPRLLTRWITGLFKVMHLLLYLSIIYGLVSFGLSQATAEFRESAIPLIRGALSTILLFFIASLIFAGLRSIFQIGEKQIRVSLLPQMRPLRWRGMEFLSGAQVRSTTTNAYVLIKYTVYVVSAYLLLVLLFSFFAFSSGWSNRILSYVLSPLRSLADGFVGYLPNLFFLAITLIVVRYTMRFFRSFFEGLSAGRTKIAGFHPEWADTTYKLAVFILLAFTAVLIFPYLPGSDSEAFKGVGLFLGFLLSLGSTAVIANMVAGTVLTYMRPFQIGDRVKIADTMGDVVEKTLLVTRIRTAKNVEVTVPNGLVLGAHIINYSAVAASEGLILHTTVTIGYDVPWPKVHGLLLEAARRTEGILDTPQPFVLQTALSDFSVAYELNGYTERPQQMSRIYSDMHRHILDCFNEAGVEILSPHYEANRDGNALTIPENYVRKKVNRTPSREKDVKAKTGRSRQKQ